jgi:ribosome-associated protein
MEEDDFISKSQRKRDMTALQDLGAALVKLAPDQLARIEMPESLRDAVTACRKFTKHEARRRQMQYIGRIMRDLDAGPIAQQLAAMHAPSHAQTALFHRAEEWRDDMLADDEAITRFVQEFPDADPRQLRVMAEKARAERAAERPPKHYREMFHAVNGILQGEGRRKR